MRFKLVKIYLIFVLSAVLINLLLEIFFRFIVRIPEPLDIRGIVVFFLIFNFFGALILLYKDYNARMMGFLSLIFGLILEFIFMKPEWVLKIYALEIGGETIAPLIISSILYWFPAWAIPSHIVHSISSKKEMKT